MTGFGRSDGQQGQATWVWELKSVNARGLDIRLRLPAGFDAIEAPVRQLISASLGRGNVAVSLVAGDESAGQLPTINEQVLAVYLEHAARLAREQGVPMPSAAELMSLRGVIDSEMAMSDAAREALMAAALAGLPQALDALVVARTSEGSKLELLLRDILDGMERACDQARTLANEQPAAIRARLQARLEDLLAGDRRIEPERLAQEVALLAQKADVREELDRLAAHISGFRSHLDSGGVIGRQLDFLAQELNREATTLCNKSASVELNRLGLELKGAIDQLREQLQNIE